MTQSKRLYRIGVDVGGTNTDAALVCCDTEATETLKPLFKIIASHKTPTSSDILTGIRAAIEFILTSAQINKKDVLSVNIGTTQLINAVIQADPSKLARVAVLRLCGPFCREVVPFTDFPSRLRQVIEGPVAYVKGGLEIDGRTIAEVDEEEINVQAQELRRSGIWTIVVAGVFSPLDTANETQEEHVRTLLEKQIPNVDVVCSKDIGQIGFLERENAAILNAAVLAFGRRTIVAFQEALRSLDLQCPLYLTQNDGTIIDAVAASKTPIKTFSSGPTNSLMGAIFLSGIHEKKSGLDLDDIQVIMADIGGTTSDFAALSASGFPRESPATVSIAGVRTAFRMPEVLSIGLGGGSIITEKGHGLVSVGPKSVGYEITSKSRCFGGSTLTATDIAVLSGRGDLIQGSQSISADSQIVAAARNNIRGQIENAVEKMKVSDRSVVLLLVGGGNVIQVDELRNVHKCIRPAHADVANAVGAAIADVAGDVDVIILARKRTEAEIVEELGARAIKAAIDNGADPDTVRIVEKDLTPLQYVFEPAFRAVFKAVGKLSWRKNSTPYEVVIESQIPSLGDRQTLPVVASDTIQDEQESSVITDIEAYTPEIVERSWVLSSTDIKLIAEGCGILGTGGGGTHYTALLHTLEHRRRRGHGKMRIIDPSSLSPSAQVVSVAYIGAPSVSNERLSGDTELEHSTKVLGQFLGIKNFDGIVIAEIGGSNGMRAFVPAAALDIPVVDADFMGRAFPKVDLALPYIYKASTPAPAALSDARGNLQVIAAAEDATRFENLARVAAVELGLYMAMTLNPVTKEVIDKFTCQGTVSLAWRLGRALALAKKQKRDFAKALCEVIPGSRLIFTGKIREVSRRVQGGFTIGTVKLEVFSDEESTITAPSDGEKSDERSMMLQFQNEFLIAGLEGSGDKLEVVCTTPDLITVLDQDDTAIGTHELRYGLRVSVVTFPADPLWKTEQGLSAGGPRALGLDFEYKKYDGEFVKSRSVIEEYSK